MTIRRNVLVAVAAVAALIVTATAGAFAGAQLIEGNIRSFVIDVVQSVPVEISAPVELESGEVITVTAPITVNVELRVSVDGRGEAKIIEDAVQEPTITVTNVVAGPTDSVEIRGLAWRVTKQENIGQELEWSSNYTFTTSGNFIALELSIENLGDVPAELLQMEDEVETRLIDERNRQFAEMDYRYQFNNLCQYAKINPGLTVDCIMVFDVAKDVKSLTLRLAKDEEMVEIPLTVR